MTVYNLCRIPIFTIAAWRKLNDWQLKRYDANPNFLNFTGEARTVI